MNEAMHQILVLAEEVACGRIVVVGSDESVEGGVGVECVLDTADGVGRGYDVGIEKEEDFAAGFHGAHIPGTRGTGLGTGGEQPGAMTERNFPRAVGGAVVDNENLQGGMVRCAQSAEAKLQLCFTVIDGDNDADGRRSQG